MPAATQFAQVPARPTDAASERGCKAMNSSAVRRVPWGVSGSTLNQVPNSLMWAYHLPFNSSYNDAVLEAKFCLH